MPEQGRCDNCAQPLQGAFCHHCGQEKKSYIRNLSGVLTEFFGEFSNWDSRLWRTLLPLWFWPGYLSKRYLNGHRVPYVPPLRLYLFTSVLTFLLFSSLFSNSVVINQPQDAQSVAQQQQVMAEVRQQLVEQGVWQEDHDMELFRLPFLTLAQQQAYNEKMQQLANQPKLAINKFFSLAPQMMLLFLPLFALMLKLLYWRSGRFYMEHLIVALHSHSFILHMLAAIVLLQLAADHSSWAWLTTICNKLIWLVLCWIPLYLFLFQKIYYQQGWAKTLLKYVLTVTIYNSMALLGFISLLVLSVLWA